MNEHYQKNTTLREENMELTTKLKGLIEQYELREQVSRQSVLCFVLVEVYTVWSALTLLVGMDIQPVRRHTGTVRSSSLLWTGSDSSLLWTRSDNSLLWTGSDK